MTNLSVTQMRHARTICAEVKELKLPVRALHIALEVARAESNLHNYANGNNPASLRIPHDAVGYDHGSVGVFQQQVGGAPNSTANWGTTAELMDVATAARKFLHALTAHPWEGADHTNWGDAQRVQRSAFSDGSNYRHWDAWAIDLGNQLWGITPPERVVVPSPTRPPNTIRYYYVEEHDTLSSIAGHFYGDERLWPEIWRANKVEVPDPNVIYPGTRLEIPT